MDAFVLDASAALKRVLEQVHFKPLRAWLAESPRRLHAPALIAWEVGNVLAREVPEAAAAAWPLGLAGIQMHEPVAMFDHAPPLSGYDAAYVELAQRLGAALVTYDAGMAKVAADAGVVVVTPA